VRTDGTTDPLTIQAVCEGYAKGLKGYLVGTRPELCWEVVVTPRDPVIRTQLEAGQRKVVEHTGAVTD
jgi:hypothetical protein